MKSQVSIPGMRIQVSSRKSQLWRSDRDNRHPIPASLMTPLWKRKTPFYLNLKKHRPLLSLRRLSHIWKDSLSFSTQNISRNFVGWKVFGLSNLGQTSLSNIWIDVIFLTDMRRDFDSRDQKWTKVPDCHPLTPRQTLRQPSKYITTGWSERREGLCSLRGMFEFRITNFIQIQQSVYP